MIGLEGKYLSGVGVQQTSSSKSSLIVTMHEAGTVLIYSSKKIKSVSQGTIESLENSIYRIAGAGKQFTLNR